MANDADYRRVVAKVRRDRDLSGLQQGWHAQTKWSRSLRTLGVEPVERHLDAAKICNAVSRRGDADI
jgi:hypothetical protein